MNQELTEQIIHHILANFGVIPSNFVNQDLTQNLRSKSFLLPETLIFENDSGTTVGKIYGCQVVVAKKDFRILLGDCTQDPQVPEFCLVSQLQDAPVYGVYLAFTKLIENPPDSEALIAVSLEKGKWVICNTYLQATYLAGMEQIKDIMHGWTKATNYESAYQMMLSFLGFHEICFQQDESLEDIEQTFDLEDE
jgi:hypothetical protein